MVSNSNKQHNDSQVIDINAAPPPPPPHLTNLEEAIEEQLGARESEFTELFFQAARSSDGTAVGPNGRSYALSSLMAGHRINAKDESRRTALMHASYLGHLNNVKTLLTSTDIDLFAEASALNATDTSHGTACQFASQANHPEIALLLLEKMSETTMNEANSISFNQSASVAFVLFCKSGNEQAVDIILDRYRDKIDMHITDREFSSLIYACGNSDVNLVKKLLQNDYDVNDPESDYNALGFACQKDSPENIEILNILIDYGIKIIPDELCLDADVNIDSSSLQTDDLGYDGLNLAYKLSKTTGSKVFDTIVASVAASQIRNKRNWKFLRDDVLSEENLPIIADLLSDKTKTLLITILPPEQASILSQHLSTTDVLAQNEKRNNELKEAKDDLNDSGLSEAEQNSSIAQRLGMLENMKLTVDSLENATLDLLIFNSEEEMEEEASQNESSKRSHPSDSPDGATGTALDGSPAAKRSRFD